MIIFFSCAVIFALCYRIPIIGEIMTIIMIISVIAFAVNVYINYIEIQDSKVLEINVK